MSLAADALVPVADASAWRGAEIADDPSWRHTLTPAEIADIARALATAPDLPMLELTDKKFPLPVLAPVLGRLLAQCRDGRGFFVIGGLPPGRFDETARERLFWGIGAHLGLAVSQNSHGEMLGHVFDQGRTYGSANTRGYQTAARLDYHTDRCDLVGLLCQRRAKEGGLSSVVSTTRIHDEILATRPDLLAILYRGFHYAEREAADNPNGVTPARIPVFSRAGGLVSCRFIRNAIENGAKRRGIPFATDEQAALDQMSTLANRADLRLDMMLEPGDMQFCDNYVIAHARTAFEDDPDPKRRRLMVRLWLTYPNRRPLAPDFGEHDGIPKKLPVEIAPRPA